MGSKGRQSVPLAVTANPEGRLARVLVERMNALDLTIKHLARATGLSYEHIRKIVNGAAYPSRLALVELCRALKLDFRKMQDLGVADRLEKKYGGVPHALAGKHPELSLLAPSWDVLTPDQKTSFRIQIRSVAQANQEQSVARKPVDSATPHAGSIRQRRRR
jgi:transcriptional regulator with XRE-family HTH domain